MVHVKCLAAPYTAEPPPNKCPRFDQTRVSWEPRAGVWNHIKLYPCVRPWFDQALGRENWRSVYLHQYFALCLLFDPRRYPSRRADVFLQTIELIPLSHFTFDTSFTFAPTTSHSILRSTGIPLSYYEIFSISITTGGGQAR